MPQYFQLPEVIMVNVFLLAAPQLTMLQAQDELFGVASLLSTWYHTLSKRSTTLAYR